MQGTKDPTEPTPSGVWMFQDFWQRTFMKDIDTLKTDYQGARPQY